MRHNPGSSAGSAQAARDEAKMETTPTVATKTPATILMDSPYFGSLLA
jgi:hypothetical protein